MSHEKRIRVINRLRKIRRGEPDVALVMSMWLLKENEAKSLMREAREIYMKGEHE